MLEAIKRKINEYGRLYQLDLTYVLKNEFWVYLRYGASLVIGLAVSVVLARWTTKEILGQYNFVLAIIGTVSIAALPGMNTAVTRSTARGNEGNYKQALRIKFLWSLLGTLALLGAGGYYYYFNSQTIGICLMVSGVFFPILYTTNIWDSFLTGKKRFDLSTIYSIIQSVINAAAMITVILTNATQLLLIVITYMAINSILGLIFYLRSLHYIENQRKDDECIKYGYFVTGTSVIGNLTSYIDRILVGTLLGAVELAIYSIVLIVPTNLKDFLGTFWGPFSPKISAQGTGIREVVDRLRKALLPIILIALVGSLLYWFFIGDVIRFLYGEKYIDAGPYARMLLFWIILTVPESFLGTFMLARKDMRAIVLANYIFPFIGLGILGSFIYLWGIMGAVWGLILAKSIRILFILIGLIGKDKLPGRGIIRRRKRA